MSESAENPYAAPSSEPQEPPPLDGVGPHNYATLGQRFLGALIDGLIMIPISVALLFAFLPVFGEDIDGPSGMEGFALQVASMGFLGGLVFSLIAMAVYIAIQWTFWKGTAQSIGKKVMKTQIVNFDGTPADVNNIAFKRYGIITLATSILPGNFGSLLGLVDALLIFRADRNCLHDDIAKTRVIKFVP